MNLIKLNSYLVILLIIIFWTPRFVESQTNNDITLGIQLFEAKKFSEAKQFFASYTKANPRDATGAYYQGRLFLRDGNYDKAIDWFKKAARLDETNSDYHLWLGRAYGVKAQRAGMLKKASAAKNIKNSFERAVELNPDNLEARMGLVQFYQMAPGIMGGSKEKAKEQAEEIKKRNVSQGHVAFGMIYLMSEQYALAEQEFQAAMERDSNNVQPYYSLSFLFARQKQFDKAEAILEELLKTRPQEVTAYFYLGRLALMSEKNLDKGEQNLKKYLQTEPSDERPSFAFAHLLLGHIYKMQAKKDLAKGEYEQALQLDPNFEQAKKALKEL